MAIVLAGMSSGLIMALVFISVGAITLFSIAKDPPPRFKAFLERIPAGTIVIAGVAASYPVGGFVGTVMALLYFASTEAAPGGGLGSPNMVFTIAVIVITSMMVAPFMILVRRAFVGLLIVTLAFIGIFGWFMPYFVDAGS